MPGLTGIEATPRITREFPMVKVVFFSALRDEEFVSSARDAGAVGHLLKDGSMHELRDAIRSARDP